MHNKAQSPLSSTAKRDPGFVKLRKGAREHLALMSSHAWKLYSLLLMAAEWKGERRGTYESTYTDIARELRWNLRMLQRNMHELREKGYVVIAGAANQYENTLITILKYDQDVASFGGDTSVCSNGSEDSAADNGADSAADNGSDTCVGSKPASSQSTKDLGPPKNLRSKEIEEGNHDAVRRPIDAELRIAICKSFSPAEKRKKLEKRLTGAVLKNRNAFDDELDDEEREAFRYIKYEPLNPQSLPCGFVFVVWCMYEDHKGEALSPGILCSKIIDRCMSEQKSCRTLGGDPGNPSEYFWPPDFQDHRDRLRAQERPREQAPRASNGLRA